MRHLRYLLLTLAAGCLDVTPSGDITGGAPQGPPGGGPPIATISYLNDIQPIFTALCIDCHGGAGGLGLENYDALIAGGDSGAVVIPGDGDGSLLIRRLDGRRPPTMPMDRPPLTTLDIQDIQTWIDEGAQEN